MTVRKFPRAGVVALRRLRSAGAIACVGALSALAAVGPPGHAQAATSGFDQMTGFGSTDSAITVPWTQGLRDSSNQPITSAGSDPASNAARTAGTGPLSFMYGDFQNLQVTVSQTEGLTHQGVEVSWTGGAPTEYVSNVPQANFLQMMECYGDANTGPDPTQCEYGSQGMLPAVLSTATSDLFQRAGELCAGASADLINPPRALDGTTAAVGCDPLEQSTGSHIAPCPGDACSGTPPTTFFVPFTPVDGSPPAYGVTNTNQYFNQFSSDEVQLAVTSPQGTGQQQFVTLTSTEAPGLGCGELESNGQPRSCWLVIVPRGQYEPNGFKVDTTQSAPFGQLNASPLSASDWAMRIQIHLGFATVPAFCPIGTQETETVGTAVAARAVSSWQLALNKSANCSRIFGFSAVPETTSTLQLSQPDSGVGLAFTTIPIGSEAARDGLPKTNLPPILYAPVAISAVGLGFNISTANGADTTPVKLTPMLMARALTQVYRDDLPDYYPAAQNHPGPSWSVNNPFNISDDALFNQLNPGLSNLAPGGPLLTEDHSTLNQQIWQWIQADPAAASWLDGTSDPSGGVTADPDYTALKLGKAPAIDSFPRAYAPCLDLGKSTTTPPKEEIRCTLDLIPYVSDYETAAANVLAANNPATGSWADIGIAPDGSTGWWGKLGTQVVGQIFMWGISDTPDLAAFGLIPAQLCTDAGTNCVGPSVASVTAALNTAKPDSAGLLQVNPAKVGTGGYPLVQVTYAAVPTNQSAAALNNYADLIAYAAGVAPGSSGQTPGAEPGDLPPGYLPLTASLKSQAQSVVTRLRADASGTGTPAPGQSTSSGPAGGTTPGGSGLTAVPGGSLNGSPGANPTASGGATPQPYNIRAPGAQLAASRTPRQPVGPIRWALLTVVIAGAACAAGGTVLRSARVPRWLHRARL